MLEKREKRAYRGVIGKLQTLVLMLGFVEKGRFF